MHDFTKLRVWQEARRFVIDVQAAVRCFPRSDRQVIGSQLRRCSLSIPATIAEGCGKSSRGETLRYLQIAAGSAAEAENHLLIAGDLGYLSPAACTALAGRAAALRRMLAALSRNLPA